MPSNKAYCRYLLKAKTNKIRSTPGARCEIVHEMFSIRQSNSNA